MSVAFGGDHKSLVNEAEQRHLSSRALEAESRVVCLLVLDVQRRHRFFGPGIRSLQCLVVPHKLL